jgi:nitric oxide reductase NorQ protein
MTVNTANTADPAAPQRPIDDYLIRAEPFYLPVAGEIELFLAAGREGLPVMLKGPTGCGKTRFVEHMAWRLGRPLITVSCHEDLFAADLVGRYLLIGDETVWMDGPLTTAVRHGGICYLDEVVEARKDTTVVIHPLADDRRVLPVDKRGEVVPAHPDFMLVISYNPGYQSVLKDLKQSTRQRFVALEFDYPAPEAEAQIVAAESGVDAATAARLVALGGSIRNIREQGLAEGASTRLLIYAGQLIRQGIAPPAACRAAVAGPLTDDAGLQETLEEIIGDMFAAEDNGGIAAEESAETAEDFATNPDA